VNDKIRLENLLVGHIGTFAFDTDIHKTNEERFLENYERNRKFVENNLKLAKHRNVLFD